MCTIWRLQTKTGGEPDKEQHIGEYCYNNKLIAMGWNLVDKKIPQYDRESIREDFDKYLEYARAYSGKGIYSVRRLKEDVKENDLVWMRIRGIYYIGRICEGSRWFFDASSNATEYDASNQRDKIEWHKAGDEGDVPGVIITAFIQGTAFQRINAEGAKMFSCALYNKLSGKEHYTNLRHQMKMDTFYDYLSPSDAEDLLCFWLYQKEGYIVIPSTNKLATQLYECVLLDTSNGKKAFIQVKMGSNRIDVQDYLKLSDQGEVFLLQTKEFYDNKDKGNKKIHCVKPKELFDFAKNKNNRNMLSSSINNWVELLFVHDSKE